MLHRPFLDKLFLVYGDGMQPRVHRHEQWLALFFVNRTWHQSRNILILTTICASCSYDNDQ